jgi:acyl-CoA thioester hydrolase
MPDPVTPTPSRRPDTEGVFGLRVRYCECDQMGVVHHAAYIPWLEEARTGLLRTSGMSFAQVEVTGVHLAVIKLETAYKRPARYDDAVEVRVRVVGGSRVKIHHTYEVRLVERPGLSVAGLATARSAGHDLLVVAATTLACLDGQGKPRALPSWLVHQR